MQGKFAILLLAFLLVSIFSETVYFTVAEESGLFPTILLGIAAVVVAIGVIILLINRKYKRQLSIQKIKQNKERVNGLWLPFVDYVFGYFAAVAWSD